MPKITLPPKVKCWRCEGTGDITIETGLDGPCDCVTDFGSRGERYVFDDLAWAVTEDGKRGVNLFGSKPRGNYGAEIVSDPSREKYWFAEGSNPTTALLNVILKFNEAL